MIEHVLINCDLEVFPTPGLEGTKARMIVIRDNDTGHIYRYPMDEALTKLVGGKLMGIGQLEVVAELPGGGNGKGHVA